MEPKLSILLGADSLLGTRSGVGRMTLEIARVLRNHDEITDFGLLMNGHIQGSSWLASLDDPNAEMPKVAKRPGVVRLKRFIGDHVPGITRLYLARQARRTRAELRALQQRIRDASPIPVVYHEPNMITYPYDGPIVATFNDLSWHHDPALHPAERIAWIERHMENTIRTASRFIAISAFTKGEMVRELGIAAERVDVVHLAPSPEFRPVSVSAARNILARYDLQDQSYVFSISTIEPRKNFDRLLNAYLALPNALRDRAPLVIAGGKGWGQVLTRPDAERALANGQLRMLGHVPDTDLVALTARCAVFAYVSLYEGFGLPVIEAMATGVPVLASATTATGETAGAAAVLVDPLNESAITEGLRRLLQSPEERARWAAASIARAAEFSWRRTVDQMAKTWRIASTLQ